MDGETFRKFAADYRKSYVDCPSEKQLAKKLGVSMNTFTRMKRRGGGRPLALACAALMHNLTEYGGER